MRRPPGPPRHPRVRPEPAVVHRAVRVTVAACAGFYAFRYGLHQPVTATYALFATVAVGVLARVEGGARARVRTLLLTLPFAWVLVCLGTVLAVHDWAAALGMALVGFTVAFGSVGGPRLVGLANGLQLFYILPCFPPYAPDDLPQRLTGVAVGLLLLAAAELLLWPEPAPADYRGRIARAAAAVARLAELTAAGCEGRAADRGGPVGKAAAPETETEEAAERARALLDELRFSRIPVGGRPATPGVVDRALTHCGVALHYVGAQVLGIRRLGTAGGPYPRAAELLRATAVALRAAGTGARTDGPVPDVAPIDVRIAAFDTARTSFGTVTEAVTEGVTDPAGPPPARPASAPPDSAPPAPARPAVARLVLGTLALNAAEGARFLTLATRAARRAPLPPDDTPPDERPGPFWYAHEPAPALWWHRIRGNLTTRSVYFRNALRTAVALSAARLVAGGLDLQHGFWVLLATLTLMRTSAADTRMTLRPALVGTTAGAAVTAVLLVGVGEHPVFYAAALPPAMLFAFTAGPVLGLAWAQATFTVVVAMVFTQLAPADWRLAETRLVNVATGAAVGILAGLCAWPRGGGQDLRRRTAELLDLSAAALTETVAVVTGAAPARGALRRARTAALLTEALYAQYRSERHDPAQDGPNWQAAVITGLHTVRGAEPLLARVPPGTVTPAGAAALAGHAKLVATAFRHWAAALLDGAGARSPTDAAETADPADEALAEARRALRDERVLATRLPADPASLHTVDVAVWLAGLLDDLSRVQGAKPWRA
ncbi:FUSC family protein [Kitasatospora sp. NPDC004240]